MQQPTSFTQHVDLEDMFDTAHREILLEGLSDNPNVSIVRTVFLINNHLVKHTHNNVDPTGHCGLVIDYHLNMLPNQDELSVPDKADAILTRLCEGLSVFLIKH